jgi:hypothetical protein
MAWRDEAAERWTAAWAEWREATEQFNDAASVTVLPERWPTADDLADHLGVDLLIENRWNPDERSGQLIADVNAGLRRVWPPVQSESVKWAELSPEPTAELAPEALDREYALNNMVALSRRGWTPTRPAIVVDIPAPDLVQTGPQGKFGCWFDAQLQRAEQWWRGKQAERDKRMGITDGQED